MFRNFHTNSNATSSRVCFDKRLIRDAFSKLFMGGIVTTETQACDISLWCTMYQTNPKARSIRAEIMEVIDDVDWTIIHVGPDKKEMAVERELALDEQEETFVLYSTSSS